MKKTFLSAFLISVIIASNAAINTLPLRKGSKAPVPRGNQEGYFRLETIAYTWERNRIAFVFQRQGSDTNWTVSVRDSWDVVEQAKSESKLWDVSSSLCSSDQWLLILDRSLTAFYADRPHAKLLSVDIEMQLIEPLWADISVGLKRKLSTMEGQKQPGIFEIPIEVGEEIQHVLDNSASMSVVTRTLEKNGLKVKSLSWSQIVMFKSSLTGRKWSEIAALPGLGLASPGVIELEVQSRE